MSLNLYDAQGHGKYLTAGEGEAFLKAAADSPPQVSTFCGTLLYTGCRTSEVSSLTACHLDLKDRRITFESLKKRKCRVYRPVPVAPSFFDSFNLVKAAHRPGGQGRRRPLALSAWHAAAARVRRQCQRQQRSLNKVQKWLGHADPKTAPIYIDAISADDDFIPGRMWH